MKKLVVLILFMFMASLASAALTVELTGGGTSAGTLVAAGADPGGFNSYLYTIAGAGTLNEPGISFLGNSVYVVEDPDGGDIQAFLEDLYTITIGQIWQLEIMDISGSPMTPSGNVANFTANAAVDVYLVDASGTVLDSASYVPEPMTMALLGFGGLFLRRRKK